jgi:Short C-terminal domain
MGDLDVPGRPAGHEATALEQTGVPPMPNIGPSEQIEAAPYPLVDGLNPTIGWQFRPRAKGGPVFMVIRRSGLGSLKVVESFPLTEDGWAAAWQSFIARNPAAVPQVLAALRARETDMARLRALEDETARLSPSRTQEASEPRTRPLVTLHKMVYLGGYLPGAELVTGDQYHVQFLEDRLLVVQWLVTRVLAELTYTEIEDVEIGGPGIVKRGGGFVGGGFGTAGAIEGMAIASILNGFTSRTSIKTILRIQGTGCELFFLHTRVNPERLRIDMSRPLAAIRSARASNVAGTQDRVPATPASPVEELSKLADMLEKGLLTRDEFERMKAKLMGLQT